MWSNTFIESEDGTMSDTLELWSEPWHALQRSLALSFGGDAKSAACEGPTSNSRTAAAAAGVTWLGRARRLAAHAASVASAGTSR